MNKVYSNYQNYSFRYDPASFTFTGYWHNFDDEKERLFLSGKILRTDGLAFSSETEQSSNVEWSKNSKKHVISGKTTSGEALFEFAFTFTKEGMTFSSSPNVMIEGNFHWGDQVTDVLPGVFSRTTPVLQASSGPAVREGDDLLFDRKHDRALHMTPRGSFQMGFDWEKMTYSFKFSHNGSSADNGLLFQVKENFVAQNMSMRYKPINKSGWFTTAPVGWMTWYSVRFDAGEYEVLENTRRMKELLGDYTDNLVTWVDWEWYHADHSGRGKGDCDIFAPRKDAYPNGMAYVAEKIKEMGCIPAIWIAPSNEGHKNKWFEEHPECVFGPWPSWSGQWWADPSRPEVCSEYIPMVMKQMLDWGYVAIKWDCLSSNTRFWGLHKEELYDQSASPEQLQCRMVQAGRDAVGDDIFMLFCNPVTDSELGTGTTAFDGARLGGDVFGWYEFCERAIDRLFRFFPLHNTVFYTDCDNIVLRKEFNSKVQARTRVSFYGITGQPVTVGDRFREYDEELIYMLRRIVPVVDVQPVEFTTKFAQGETRKIVNAFNRPYGSWQVAALINTRENLQNLTLDFASDCRLKAGKKYAVYDYWKNTFLGIFDSSVQISVAPFDTAVLRITPVEDEMLPTLVSSSRHITQGGYELTAMTRDLAVKTLSGTVKCVAGEPCRLSFYVPEGLEVSCEGGTWEQKGRCGVLTCLNAAVGETDWKISVI